MVATRRGTRIDPSEERGGEKHGGQPTMDSATPASQVKTRSRVKRESQSEDAGGNDVGVESTPSELLMVGAQVVTRRRHKSGQSEGDVSEADSTTSSHSTRASRSRSVGVCLTESARKLRSHRSVLVTEPIPESKEDGDISEAESNCSSASSRVKKRQSASILSLITRSRRSVVAPESVINIKEDTDISETESNCSSVSGIRSVRRTRNARTSIRKPLVEPLVDEISDAESCSSGISAQPIARRLNMRNKYKSLQDNMLSDEAKSEADQVEMPIQREMAYDAKVSEPLCSENSSSNAETKLPSSRRSVRIGQNNVRMIYAIEEHTQEIANKASDEEDKEKSSHDKASVLSNDDSFESSTQINLKSKDPIDQSDFSANPESLMDVEQHPSESSDTSKEPTLILSTNSANCSTEIPEETNNDLDQDNPQSSSVVSKDELNELPCSNISLLLDSDDSDQTEESDSEDELEDEEGEINTALFVGNGKESRKSDQVSEELLGDGLFVIDTKPGIDSSEKYYMGSEEDDDAEDKMAEDAEPCKSGDNDDDDDFIDEDADEDDTLLNKPKMGFSLSTSIDTGLRMKDLGGLYISFDASKPNPGSTLLQKMKQGHKKADELLKNSVITPDFEKKDCVPLNRVHLKKLKKLRRQEREKTTGQGWFDMKAPELTEELKNDLKALKMRSAMDPKRFYKKNDRDGFPKYFQVGTVVDNPIDFYHSRIPKKERKRTIVEELLADAEFRRYNKRKYQEIIAEKAAQAEGKKNRKKKKFRN